jgi:hypothetical protein
MVFVPLHMAGYPCICSIDLTYLFVIFRNLSQRQRTLIEEYVKEEMRDSSTEEKSAAAGN